MRLPMAANQPTTDGKEQRHMDVKPGYTTTEWWTTLGAHVIAIIALFHTANANSWAQAVVGIAVAVGPEIGAAVYTHSRSRLKAATSANLAVKAAQPPVTTTPVRLPDIADQPGVPVPVATGQTLVPPPPAAPTS